MRTFACGCQLRRGARCRARGVFAARCRRGARLEGGSTFACFRLAFRELCEAGRRLGRAAHSPAAPEASSGSIRYTSAAGAWCRCGTACERVVRGTFRGPRAPAGVSRDVGAAAAAAARQARRCRHRTATAAAGRRSRYAPRGGTRVRASSLVASHAACWDVLSTPWQRLGPTLGLISSLVRQIYLCNRSVMPSARDPSPESCARLPRRRSHASVCARSARLCARL